MKLIDELKEIERHNAIAGGAWPATLETLSMLMRERARMSGWGAMLVGVHSAQVEAMLRGWAMEQGLEVLDSTGGFTRALWLVWGYKPPIAGLCDAEVMPDGSLRTPQKLTDGA